MKPYQPVRWPCYIWWRDELKPRRKYLLLGPRNQGKRTASNYGFLIVAKKGTPSWTIEQEKYESRYWLCRPWRLMHWIWFAQGIRSHKWREENPNAYKRAAAHLARVECASRAQEIRAYYAWFLGHHGHPSGFDIDNLSRRYAESIHNATNYPFFAAAGWDEERVYNEIVKHL